MIGLKSTNFRTVSLPGSVNDLTALLAFLGDKKSFQKHLDELLKLTNEANEAIENVGKAKKINDLLLEAEAVNEKAKASAAAMKEKGARELTTAENTAVAILSDAKSSALLMTTEAQAIKNGTADSIKKLREDQEVIAIQSKANTDRAADLDKRESAVESAEKEMERKRKVLAQL